MRGMSDRLREPEARQNELNERLAAVPAHIPDIHPDIAVVYRRGVERLAEALAAPGDKHGEMHATLHGNLGTIIEWAGARGGKKVTDIPRGGMSVSVVAGAGFEPATFGL